MAQNEAEVDIYTNPKTRPIVAKVYASADDYSWIVAELTRPLKSAQEFEELIGVDIHDFDSIINKIERSGSVQKTIEQYQEMKKAHKRHQDVLEHTKVKHAEKYLDILENNEVVQAVGSLISNNFLLPGDLSWHHHWGKTPNGRPVILDYGFTEKVYQDYYR